MRLPSAAVLAAALAAAAPALAAAPRLARLRGPQRIQFAAGLMRSLDAALAAAASPDAGPDAFARALLRSPDPRVRAAALEAAAGTGGGLDGALAELRRDRATRDLAEGIAARRAVLAERLAGNARLLTLEQALRLREQVGGFDGLLAAGAPAAPALARPVADEGILAALSGGAAVVERPDLGGLSSAELRSVMKASVGAARRSPSFAYLNRKPRFLGERGAKNDRYGLFHRTLSDADFDRGTWLRGSGKLQAVADAVTARLQAQLPGALALESAVLQTVSPVHEGFHVDTRVGVRVVVELTRRGGTWIARDEGVQAAPAGSAVVLAGSSQRAVPGSAHAAPQPAGPLVALREAALDALEAALRRIGLHLHRRVVMRLDYQYDERPR